MKDKFWEVLFFLDLYPKGMNILIIGLIITVVYYSYGAYSVPRMQLASSSVVFKDALRNFVMGMYEEKSMGLLVVVITASLKQLAKDKKKFDKFG